MITMSDMKAKVAAFREEQEFFVKISTIFDRNRKALEQELETLLKETMKAHKLLGSRDSYYGYYSNNRAIVYLSFNGGSATGNWDPHYYISSLQDDGVTFVAIEDKWVAINKGTGGKVYAHNLDYTKRLKTISVEEIQLFRDDLAAKSGLEVRLHNHTIVNKHDIKIPRSEDDLLLLHEDGAIACSGQKWHEGWDIADPWAIVRTRKGHYVVYYATNGHGFGYDQCIMPDKPVDDFYLWLGGKPAVQMTIPSAIIEAMKNQES